ncbi:hypothetical protein [Paenibacillus sp. 203]|uniref:hypothetical protein n=1 Tax=Paenibacillus sp. 203 TaxID=3096765 RepID=UPI00300BE3BB
MPIHNAKLWELLNDFLYHLKLQIMQDEQVIDINEQPFGIRMVEVRDGKFLITNRFISKGLQT